MKFSAAAKRPMAEADDAAVEALGE